MALFPPFLKWYLFGVIAFLAIPLTARAIPEEYADRRQQLLNFFDQIAMNFLGSSIMVYDPGSGFRIEKAKQHGKLPTWLTYERGEWLHQEDKLGNMSRLAGRPFGLVHADRALIQTPRMMAIGESVRQLRESGREKVTASLSNGEAAADGGRETFWKAYITLDREPRAVDPEGGLAIIRGTASRDLPERIQDLVEKAHIDYNSTPKLQYMTFVFLFGISFGIMWFGSQLVSAGGGSSISSSIPLG